MGYSHQTKILVEHQINNILFQADRGHIQLPSAMSSHFNNTLTPLPSSSYVANPINIPQSQPTESTLNPNFSVSDRCANYNNNNYSSTFSHPANPTIISQSQPTVLSLMPSPSLSDPCTNYNNYRCASTQSRTSTPMTSPLIDHSACEYNPSGNISETEPNLNTDNTY